MEKLRNILNKRTLDENDLAFIRSNRRHLTDADLVRLGFKKVEEPVVEEPVVEEPVVEEPVVEEPVVKKRTWKKKSK